MYEVNWTEQAKQQAIDKLTEYFTQHGHGESIMQSDNGQIEGLEVLCDIADDVLGEEGIEYVDEDNS